MRGKDMYKPTSGALSDPNVDGFDILIILRRASSIPTDTAGIILMDGRTAKTH